MPFFYSADAGLIKVECRCGWKGYFDNGRDTDDWVEHLYKSSILEIAEPRAR